MTGWRVLKTGLAERLAASAEAPARWVALTVLQRRSADDSEVVRAHADVMADPLTEDLLARLHPWDVEVHLSGHDKPAFLPNLLGVLADRGVDADDDPRIAAIHASMLEHATEDGRFQSFGRLRGTDLLIWSTLPCDGHAITETLARAGHVDDPRVVRAMERIAADLVATRQGPGWLCVPDPVVGFRGPGRKEDACPQVGLEALRAFSYLAPGRRPVEVLAAARTSLAIWRNRGSEKPYMFGHGRQFKRVKWPPVWYSALAIVDAVGRYPEVWAGADADPHDRRALAELAACVIAYNTDDAGQVIPRSVSTGFEAHSFGQKKRPSDFAAARVAAVLTRVEDLADDIAAVDVRALGSSKGGSGVALAP